MSKRDIFDVLVQWRDSVTENIKGLQFTEQQDVDEIIEKWQLETRLRGRHLTIPKGLFSIIIALVYLVMLALGRFVEFDVRW